VGKRPKYSATFTMNLLIFLDGEPGFVFNIIPGASNSFHYTNFWLKTASHSLMEGDIVIVDNCNFHVQGISSKIVRNFLKIIGVEYYSLPPYSPELNPAELVFAQLKKCLENNFANDAKILSSIMKCLKEITLQHIMSYYRHCKYI
jgi:hypothetical protein